MKKDDIHEFFRRLHEIEPEPKSDLEWTNAYTLLVAVTLSAQATDAGVNKATKNLFKIADTPQKMLDLGIDGLKEHIKTIGLYNNKAKNVIAMAEMLLKDFNGEVPQNREDLVKLPGVGRKTANVVLNIVFQQPTMAVDTHIFRVSNRTGLAPGKKRRSGRTKSFKSCAGRIRAPRPSLADPAWPLHLQGAQTRVRQLCRLRSVRI